MTIPVAPPAIDVQAKLFRGLADRSRLAILEALRDGPRNVGEIAAAAGLTQPNASNHLHCLLDYGLVSRAQRGKYAIYALADPRVGELLALAETVLADVARGVAACPRYRAPETNW
ncbi:MAG TPA: metalloregulator ArsR/SmtB family transcription factor [Thermomicrobiales bacterium]|nr:metalloregulator ArsR/SmtB family transcription factor [Thermomicrobiales bacterium]